MKLKIDVDKFLEETADIIAMESPSDTPSSTDMVSKYFKDRFDEIGWNTELLYLDPLSGTMP